MSSSKTFETLYGIDTNNKLKQWSITVENHDTHSLIICEYGYVDGKKTTSKTKVEKGKNIGKKNETTHFQQAVLEATSKWTKKQESGYSKEKNEEKEEEILLPMLAQDYTKHKKKIKFPCFIQPKLDGYRMAFNSSSKQCLTRNGKEFSVIYETDLYKELSNIRNINLDGELYIHDKSFSFESYGVLRKTKKLSKEDIEKLEKIEYHVYDAIDEDKTFNIRNELLKSLETNKIKVVQTFECKNVQDIEKYHEIFIKDGYEGSIIRNKNGMYKQKYRSYDLQKYKNFDDGEYTIVDYTFEKDTTGNDDNLVVWICETPSKKRFNVQSKGTREERQEIYKNAGSYINKMLWVQHFGLTNDGVPRFPKTMRNGLESIRMEVL